MNPAGNSFGCDQRSDLNDNENTPPTVEHNDDPGSLSAAAASVSSAINNGTTDEICQDQLPAVHSNGHSSRRPSRRKTAIEERGALLIKQTDMQEETLKKKLEENTYKIAKSLQQLVGAQNEQNKILKDNARQKALDNLEKRKLKVRELELKQKEIELKKTKVRFEAVEE